MFTFLLRVSAVAGLLLATLGAAVPASAQGGPYHVAGSVGEGIARALPAPTRSPAGVNRSDCQLTSAHPSPVVLVPGTFSNMEDDYGALGPELANAGYCVYSLNYGAPAGAFIQATGPLAASGQQVAGFVNQVLDETDAAKVDLVGHSQGGTLIEYYAKVLNGASRVDKLVAIAPTTHGTTLDGLARLANVFPGANKIVNTVCAACRDQEIGSPFVHTLNDGPVAEPGVAYTVIATRYDIVATPAGRASFIREPGVVNKFVQDSCPADFVDHVDTVYDQTVIRLLKNALDPSTARAPNCFAAFPWPAH